MPRPPSTPITQVRTPRPTFGTPQDMNTPQAVRPVAMWGPAILIQIEDELTSGICTFNGQLRIVSMSHHPLGDHLNRVRDILDAAC